MTTGLDGVLPLLACPICAGGLTRRDGVVGCAAGHRYDVARQGYLTLLGPGSRLDTGDTADMVAARQEFLDAGHFAPLTAAIVAAAGPGPVLDLGAGTGHHLRAVVERSGDVGLALDTSRLAARRAAKVHARVGSVVADAWSRLPVRDGAVGTVLNVFAPRDPGELARVLRPGGRAVIVTPTPEHQQELRARIGLLDVDPDKADRLVRAMGPALTPIDRTPVRHVLTLARADVDRLIRMGPSAYHLPADRRQAAVRALGETTEVTLSATVSVFAARR
ncbi:putative RNA methyltransferase [Nakamurella sp.]|uniref:putative RNA methyltransferase n=1 Tax=Nakamurella sp. TaxID=1869182 RepID=UPI003B3B39AE